MLAPSCSALPILLAVLCYLPVASALRWAVARILLVPSFALRLEGVAVIVYEFRCFDQLCFALPGSDRVIRPCVVGCEGPWALVFSASSDKILCKAVLTILLLLCLTSRISKGARRRCRQVCRAVRPSSLLRPPALLW